MDSPVRVEVQERCQGTWPCEHLISLTAPAAGGDGMLLGVVESKQAAEAIASSLSKLLALISDH